MSGAWVCSLAWLGREGRVHSQCIRQALCSILATCITPRYGEEQRNRCKWAAELSAEELLLLFESASGLHLLLGKLSCT